MNHPPDSSVNRIVEEREHRELVEVRLPDPDPGGSEPVAEAEEDDIPSLTPQELHTRQASGELVYLLDVRLLDEYQAGHIPGAHFCPGTQVALLVESLVGVKNAPNAILW